MGFCRKGKLMQAKHTKMLLLRSNGRDRIEKHKHWRKISSTLHLYQIEDEWVIKKSYWYWMKSNDRELIPQAEEEITEAKWIPFSQLEEMQKLVYFSLSGLVGKINDCLLQGVRSTD